MKELKNKEVTEINVYGDYHDYMEFVTKEGPIAYFASGDCCSSSFFSDIWNAENIVNQEVINVEDISLEAGEAPNRGAEEDDNEKIYGIKITSKIGSCVIIFRNHSNGYYGGGVDLVSQVGDKAKAKKWNITNNWSAPLL
jgi:hypothetical protein